MAERPGISRTSRRQNVIHHSRNARDTFRRRAIGIVREREELFQRFGVAARRTPGVRGVIESSLTRELFDLRRPGRILLTSRQIFLGKMKATIGIIAHPVSCACAGGAEASMITRRTISNPIRSRIQFFISD